MQLVLLVRHGHSAADPKRLVGRTPGIGLSADGSKEAERVAERLRAVRLAAVYSSPLQRCMETAEAIARGRRLSVRTEDGVQEVDFGSWQGRTYKSLLRTPLWRKVQFVPSLAKFPDGESVANFQSRGVEAVERIRGRHRGHVAVVSHADMIKAVAAYYLGLHLDLYQRIVVPTASVTALAFGDGFPRLLRLGDTGDYSDFMPSKAPRSRGGLQR